MNTSTGDVPVMRESKTSNFNTGGNGNAEETKEKENTLYQMM